MESSLILKWLKKAIDSNASDLHLVCGYQPVLRVHGKLTPIAGEEVLTSEALTQSLEPIWNEVQRGKFANELNLDYAAEVEIDAMFCPLRMDCDTV